MLFQRIHIMIFIAVFLCMGTVQAQNKYVGVKTCAMCHKAEARGNQFGVWQKTKHAEAYAALTTPRADSVAKARGLAKPAAQSQECLQCHVAAAGADAALLDKNFDYKDGVQCEVCHGAGSSYDKIATMKDKAKAVAAGLHELKDAKEAEKTCRGCHNEKSPFYKEFKFDERWAKIKHPLPKS